MRVDDDVEVLVAHLPEHAVAQHARVGDHHVQAPELAHGAGDERLRHVGVADRGDLRDGAPARAGDRRDGLRGAVGIEVVDDERGAGARQRDRVRAAEPAAASGDDGDLAVEAQCATHA